MTCIITARAAAQAADIIPVAGPVRSFARPTSTPAADVVVDVPRRHSDGFRTRRFAAVTLGALPATAPNDRPPDEATDAEADALAPRAAQRSAEDGPTLTRSTGPPVALVSTHVLHALEATVGPAASAEQQPTNVEHIWASVVEIGAAFAPHLAAGGVVLAVGDFNGPLRLEPTELLSCPPLDVCAPEWAELLRQLPPRALHATAAATDSALPCAGFCAASPATPTQFAKPHAVDGAVLLSCQRLELRVDAI